MIHDEIDQTIADLEATADYIEANEWCQGQAYIYDTKMTISKATSLPIGTISLEDIKASCAWGAMMIVTGERVEDDIAKLHRSSNMSRAFYRAVGVDVTTYNDMDGQNKKHIADKLREIAIDLKKDPRRA